jgi:hypothetical protein
MPRWYETASEEKHALLTSNLQCPGLAWNER